MWTTRGIVVPPSTTTTAAAVVIVTLTWTTTAVVVVVVAGTMTTPKMKAPLSWASLLKDTTSAANAIVINMNDNNFSPTVIATASGQLRATDSGRSLVSGREPTMQHSGPGVSVHGAQANNEKLKLQVSGLYVSCCC